MTETTVQTNEKRPNVHAALAALGNFSFPKEVALGAAYVVPDSFKSELAERAEVRAAAQAKVADIPAALRDSIPASVIAALLKSNNFDELAERYEALTRAIETAERADHAKIGGIHYDDMTREQKLEYLRHEIEKIDETLEDRMQRWHSQGLLTDEEYKDWEEKKRAAQADPNNKDAQDAYADATRNYIGTAQRNAQQNGTYTPAMRDDFDGGRDAIGRRGDYVDEQLRLLNQQTINRIADERDRATNAAPISSEPAVSRLADADVGNLGALSPAAKHGAGAVSTGNVPRL